MTNYFFVRSGGCWHRLKCGHRGRFLQFGATGQRRLRISRWVIHDWDDDRARTILRNCHAVLPPVGRLLLVESVIPPGNEPHPSKLMDFVMLTALGGRERTADEYRQLLEEAGFRMSRVLATDSPMGVIAAVRN